MREWCDDQMQMMSSKVEKACCEVRDFIASKSYSRNVVVRKSSCTGADVDEVVRIATTENVGGSNWKTREEAEVLVRECRMREAE